MDYVMKARPKHQSGGRFEQPIDLGSQTYPSLEPAGLWLTGAGRRVPGTSPRNVETWRALIREDIRPRQCGELPACNIFAQTPAVELSDSLQATESRM
jgi:hypothetical protein